jgi:hypothetical protein
MNTDTIRIVNHVDEEMIQNGSHTLRIDSNGRTYILWDCEYSDDPYSPDALRNKLLEGSL